MSRRWLGCSFWSPAIGRQGGVATLISPRCLNDVVSWRKDSHSCIISTLIRIGDVDINFVNIHAPTNLTDRKFYEVHDYIFYQVWLLLSGVILIVMINLSESKCEITPCSVSDHDFVSFVFDIPDSIKHGPGVCNFNNSLLNDKIFCDRIQRLIEDHVSFSCFPSIQDWWEFLKESMLGIGFHPMAL